jgi:hypothetical protein
VGNKALVKLDIALLAAWLILITIPAAQIPLPPPTRAVLMNSLISMVLEEDGFKLGLILHELLDQIPPPKLPLGVYIVED